MRHHHHKDSHAGRPALPCPDCTGRLLLQDTRFGLAYLCENWPACKGSHGAHPDGRPMGTPASKDTKLARIRAHAAFDAIWQRPWEHVADYASADENARRYIEKAARNRAYAWLRDRMGMTRDECHIGLFGIEQCERVVELCRGVTPFIIRQWHKEERAHEAEPESESARF